MKQRYNPADLDRAFNRKEIQMIINEELQATNMIPAKKNMKKWQIVAGKAGLLQQKTQI